MEEMWKRGVPLPLLDQLIANQEVPPQKRDPNREGEIGRQIGNSFGLTALAAFARLFGWFLVRSGIMIPMLRQHKATGRDTRDGGTGRQRCRHSRRQRRWLAGFHKRSTRRPRTDDPCSSHNKGTAPKPDLVD